MDRIEQASADELVEVEGIGPIIAESIERFFSEDRNRTVIEKLAGRRREPRGPDPGRRRPKAARRSRCRASRSC